MTFKSPETAFLIGWLRAWAVARAGSRLLAPSKESLVENEAKTAGRVKVKSILGVSQ